MFKLTFNSQCSTVSHKGTVLELDALTNIGSQLWEFLKKEKIGPTGELWDAPIIEDFGSITRYVDLRQYRASWPKMVVTQRCFYAVIFKWVGLSVKLGEILGRIYIPALRNIALVCHYCQH